MKKTIYVFVFLMSVFTAPVLSQVKTSAPKTDRKKKTARVQYGTASLYHNKFIGRKTANGDNYSQKKLTAAHNSVPLGTWVKVTNLSNYKTVIVKIIDRLHYKNRRLIDLSTSAATMLNYSKGLLKVKVEVLGKSYPGP